MVRPAAATIAKNPRCQSKCGPEHKVYFERSEASHTGCVQSVGTASDRRSSPTQYADTELNLLAVPLHWQLSTWRRSCMFCAMSLKKIATCTKSLPATAGTPLLCDPPAFLLSKLQRSQAKTLQSPDLQLQPGPSLRNGSRTTSEPSANSHLALCSVCMFGWVCFGFLSAHFLALQQGL